MTDIFTSEGEYAETARTSLGEKEDLWVVKINKKLDVLTARLDAVENLYKNKREHKALTRGFATAQTFSDMPFAMSGHIQSVVINGTLYVGGGWTDKKEDFYQVMAYNIKSCQWHTLPPYSTWGFAMATINNKLVLVGGVITHRVESSELGEWQPDNKQWTRPFPPMLKSRQRPSATTYKNWLVVVGGWHDYIRLQSLEILDISNMQWSFGPSSPIRWQEMKSTTIGDVWYIMGGFCNDLYWGPDVYSVSLEALVSQPESETSNVWKKLPPLNCRLSCPLNVRGSLLAVGGKDVKSDKPLSTIQRYVPETNTWVEVGQLPYLLYRCTCIMTSDKAFVMGGHGEKARLRNTMFYTL